MPGGLGCSNDPGAAIIAAVVIALMSRSLLRKGEVQRPGYSLNGCMVIDADQPGESAWDVRS